MRRGRPDRIARGPRTEYASIEVNNRETILSRDRFHPDRNTAPSYDVLKRLTLSYVNHALRGCDGFTYTSPVGSYGPGSFASPAETFALQCV